MTEPARKHRESERLLLAPSIHCRRVDRAVPLTDHLSCPYCFGDAADVKSGDYQRFCDFRPGEDPVNLGFPKV